MKTIQITAPDPVIEKVKAFLETLKVSGVVTEPESQAFLAEASYLQSQLDEMDAGKAVFYSLHEAEEEIEKTLRRYENPGHR